MRMAHRTRRLPGVESRLRDEGPKAAGLPAAVRGARDIILIRRDLRLGDGERHGADFEVELQERILDVDDRMLQRQGLACFRIGSNRQKGQPTRRGLDRRKAAFDRRQL